MSDHRGWGGSMSDHWGWGGSMSDHWDGVVACQITGDGVVACLITGDGVVACQITGDGVATDCFVAQATVVIKSQKCNWNLPEVTPKVLHFTISRDSMSE